MNKEKKNSDTENKGSGISDVAKKVLLTGLGAIFMTEESIRNALTDMKLPKEAMGFVVDQAKKQKEDLISAVAGEVSKFFAKVKVHEEIEKVLSHLKVNVNAELSFSPQGKMVTEDIKIKVENL